MKSFILMLGMAIMVSCSSASHPPKAVQDAFQQKFPSASDVKWGKENSSEWEAEFKVDKNDVSANFSEDGTWTETETEIPVSGLPATVVDAIKKGYANWEITGADRIEHTGGALTYEADIKYGKDTKEVAFNPDGTPAK